MNKIYRVIFNKARGIFMAVSELTNSHSKEKSSVEGVSATGTVRGFRLAPIVVASLLGMGLLSAPSAWANDINTDYGTIAPTGQGCGNYDGVLLNLKNDNDVVNCGAYQGVAIGRNASTYDEQSRNWNNIAIGTDSKAYATNSIAMGSEASARAQGATVIGYKAWADWNAVDAVVIGRGASAAGDGGKKDEENNMIAVGASARARGNQATVLGSSSAAREQATAVGNDVYALGGSSIAIGNDDIVSSKYKDKLPEKTIEKIFNPLWAVNGTGDKNAALIPYGNAQDIGSFYYKYIKSQKKDSNGNWIENSFDDKREFSPTFAGQLGAIAIGSRTVAGGEVSTAVGSLSFALANRSTAIGIRAFVTDTAEGATAVGENTRVYSKESVAIGNQAEATDKGTVSYGYRSKAVGTGSLALGYATVAGAAINPATYKTLKESTAAVHNIALVNPDGSLNNTNRTAFKDAVDDIVKDVDKGFKDNAMFVQKGTDGLAPKEDGSNAFFETTVLDENNQPKTQRVYAIQLADGDLDTADIQWAENSMAVGRYAFALRNNTVAFGYATIADAASGIAIGSYSHVTDKAPSSVALGVSAYANGKNSLVMGYSASTHANNSLVLGMGATAGGFITSTDTPSTRTKTLAGGTQETIQFKGKDIKFLKIGGVDYQVVSSADAESDNFDQQYPTIIDQGNGQYQYLARNSSALGMLAKATAFNSTALGNFSNADMNNSMALGYRSQTDYSVEDLNKPGWVATGAIAIPTSAATGVISVGAINQERRITNVASGYRDSDAVNVAQLKTLDERISNITGSENSSGLFQYMSIESKNKEGKAGALAQVVNKERNYSEYITLRKQYLGFVARNKLNGETIDKTALDKIKDRIDALAKDNNFSTLSVELKKVEDELTGISTPTTDKTRYDAIVDRLTSAFDTDKNATVLTAPEKEIKKQVNASNFKNDGAVGKDSLAVGWRATTGTRSTKTENGETVEYYDETKAKGDHAIAAGFEATATGKNAIAIGGSDTIKGNNTLNQATGANSVAIGTANTVEGTQSIAIGYGHTVSGANSGAFGDPSTISSNNSYAVGNGNNISATDAFAIGNNNIVTKQYSFVMGHNVDTTNDLGGTNVYLGDRAVYIADGVNSKGATNDYKSATVGDFTFSNFAQGSSGVDGVVTIAAAPENNAKSFVKTRRLQGVAPGLISENSVDAINGSQLYSVANTLGSEISVLKTKVSNGSSNWFNVNSTADSSPTNPDNYDASSQRKGAIGANSVAIGKNATANGAGGVAMGFGAKVTADAPAGSVAIGSGSTADAVHSDGPWAIGNGAAAALVVQDTAKIAELKKASDDAATLYNTKNLEYDGMEDKTTPGAMALQKELLGEDLQGTTSGLKYEATKAREAYRTAQTEYQKRSVFAVGSAGAERQIQHVAAGVISATSTDAINGSQLFATNTVLSKLVDKVGDGPINGVDGASGKDGQTIAGTPGTPGAAGAQGVPGDSGAGGSAGTDGSPGLVGPAGRDGLNGTPMDTKIQGLRDGVAGTVVYTDKAGNRVLVENGKYYAKELVAGKVKADNGLWYDAANVNPDGSLKNPADKSGKSLADLSTSSPSTVLTSDQVVLSAVNPDGKTVSPVSLGNLASVLGINPTGTPLSETKPIALNNEPITLTAARNALGAPAGADPTANPATGLFAMKGAELNRAATAADLQALAVAGMNLAGRTGTAINAPLGGTFNIIGDDSETTKTGAARDKYVTTEATADGLKVKLTGLATGILDKLDPDHMLDGNKKVLLSGNTGKTKDQTLGQEGDIAFGIKGDDATITTSITDDSTDVTIKVKDGGIGADQLGTGAVTTTKIADGNVTKAKLDSGVQGSLANADKVYAQKINLTGDDSSTTTDQTLGQEAPISFKITGGDDGDITTRASGSQVSLALNKATTVAAGDNKVVTSDAVATAINAAKTTVSLAADSDSSLTLTDKGSAGNHAYEIKLTKTTLVDNLKDEFATVNASNIKSDQTRIDAWKDALGITGITKDSGLSFLADGTGSAKADVGLGKQLDITGDAGYLDAVTTAATETTNAKLSLALTQDVKDKLAKIDKSQTYVTTARSITLKADGSTTAGQQSLANDITFTIKGDGTTIEAKGDNTAHSITLNIKEGGVNTNQLANNAVTEAKLAKDAVTTEKIKNESVTQEKLAVDLSKKINDSAAATITFTGDNGSTTNAKQLSNNPTFSVLGDSATGKGDIKVTANASGLVFDLVKALNKSDITSGGTKVVTTGAVYDAIVGAKPVVREAKTTDLTETQKTDYTFNTDADNIIKVVPNLGTDTDKDTFSLVLTKGMLINALKDDFTPSSAATGGITFVDDHHNTQPADWTTDFDVDGNGTKETYNLFTLNSAGLGSGTYYIKKSEVDENTITKVYKVNPNNTAELVEVSNPSTNLGDYTKVQYATSAASAPVAKKIDLNKGLKFESDGYVSIDYDTTTDYDGDGLTDAPVLRIGASLAVKNAIRMINDGTFGGGPLSYKVNAAEGFTTSLLQGLDFRGETPAADFTAPTTGNQNITIYLPNPAADNPGVVNFTLNPQLQNMVSIGSGVREDDSATKTTDTDKNRGARLTFTSATSTTDPVITANDVKLTGLLDGEIAAGSKDAITGGQLSKELGINNNQHNSIGDRITKLEQGLKGTVVYTDKDGNRVVRVVDGNNQTHFYKYDSVKDYYYNKADGRWYSKWDSTTNTPVTNTVKTVDALSSEEEKGIILSLVDKNEGDVNALATPIKLGNLASVLGIDPKAAIDTSKPALLGGKPIEKDAAQKVIGDSTATTTAEKGLYALQGADLNRAATIGDLQALAVAGFDILGNQENDTGKANRIRKTLGSLVKIEGKSGALYNSTGYEAANYSADNLITHNDNGTLRIEMLKKPLFDALKLQNSASASNPVVTLTPGTDTAAPSLTLDAGDGSTAKPVQLKGIADGKDANDAVNVSQLQEVKDIVGKPGSNGANGNQGLAGADGLNGQNLFNQVDALRNGLAGPVVYTDKDGVRVISEDNEYYYRESLIDNKKKGSDGLWYDEAYVKDNGTLNEQALTSAGYSKDADGKWKKDSEVAGKTLAELNSALGTNGNKKVNTENVILSTVNPDGTTTKPITLANLVGALGATMTATSGATNTLKATTAPKTENAQAIVANLLQGKAGTTANSTEALDMSRVATAADLQIVARAGLVFSGNNSTTKVNRALSQELAITGYTTDASGFTELANAKAAANNIFVEGKAGTDTTADTLTLKLAKDLVAISSIGSGATKGADKEARISFTNGAEDNTAGTPVDESQPTISMNNARVVSVAPGVEATDALNVSQLAGILGTANQYKYDPASNTWKKYTTGDSASEDTTGIGGTGENTIDAAIKSLKDGVTAAASGAFTLAGDTIKSGSQGDGIRPGDKLTIKGATDSGISTEVDPASDTISLSIANKATFGTHAGVDVIDGDGTELVQEKAVKTYVDKLADKIGVGSDGINGVDGTAGPAGQDGLNKTTLVNKVQGLRDGIAGTVVYTDTAGNRVLAENGKYYKSSVAEGYKEASDGFWYKKELFNADGTLDSAKVNNASETDKHRTLAQLAEGKSGQVLDNSEVILSAVNPDGNTTTPVTLANLADSLAVMPTDKEILDKAKETNADFETLDDNAKAAALTAAKEALVTEYKAATNEKYQERAKKAVADLIAKDFADKSLSKAVTLRDLQTLAQAGLDFVGNDDNKVHRALSQTLSIKGDGTPATDFASAENNIKVIQNTDKDGLTIQLATKLVNMTSIAGKTAADKPTAATITFGEPVATGGTPTISMNDARLTNVADGKDGKDAVNVNQLKAVADQIGVPVNAKDGINGVDGTNGTTKVEYADGKGVPGTNGKAGTQGQTGPAGKDGLNGTTLVNKVQGLRDGVAGTVVYTDKDGNRVLVENGNYYKPALVSGLEKANDGKWYDARVVGADGSVDAKKVAEAKDAIDKSTSMSDAEKAIAKAKLDGTTLKELAKSDSTKVVQPTDVMLSAVNPNGDTNAPTTLANVRSALGLSGRADNVTGTDENLKKPAAINADAAQKVIAGDSKDGKGGLLTKSGAVLNRVTTLGDLQALAQAGLDFTGSLQATDVTATGTTIHRPVGTGISIIGAKDKAAGLGEVSDYDNGKNLATVVNKDTNEIQVVMKKQPTFEAVKLNDGQNGSTTTIIKTNEKGDVIFGKDGKNGADGKVVISGIKDGDTADSAVTKGALDDIKKQLGLDGKDGANGHNGVDGVADNSIVDKVEALRDGTAGPVVYTDKDGNRVKEIGEGNYYKLADIQAVEKQGLTYYAKGPNGKGSPGWYNDQGEEVHASNDEGATDAQKALATMNAGLKTADQLKLSLVNAKEGSTKSATQLSNVAAGTLATDAVNVQQLTDAKTELQGKIDGVSATANSALQSFDVTGNGPDTEKVSVNKKDAKFAIKGEQSTDRTTPPSATAKDNIYVEAKNKTVTVKLAANLKNLESATFNDATGKSGFKVDANGVQFTKDGNKDSSAPSITKDGIDAGDKKITNVAAGTISATSEDAINGSQLAKLMGNVAFDNDGNITADPSDADGDGNKGGIGGTGKTTINDAINEVRQTAGATTVKAGKNIKVTPNTEGAKVYTVSMEENLEVETIKVTNNIQLGNVNITNQGDPQYHGDVKNIVNVTGTDGQATVITGVADGIGPNDAVNMSQLSKLAGQVGEVDRKVEKYKRESNAGTATAIAIASLPQAADAGANMFSISGGSYDGETATAIGISRRSDNGKFIIRANGSFNSRGKVGVGVGVGFQWR